MFSPKCTHIPIAVPTINEKITAGIFFIRTIELIPIPIAQHPKTIFNFSLKSDENLLLAIAPTNPPKIIDKVLVITPIGIKKPPY